MEKQIIHKGKKFNLVGQYAGFVSRLVAFFIDIFIISMILITISWFISTSINLFQLNNLVHSFSKSFPIIITIEEILFNPITASLFSLFIIFTYNIFFWSFSGSSPGKSIMGIRIVPLNGNKISILRGLIRYIGYYISAIPFGLGFLWAIIDDRRMGWHDKISHTCVVYTWNACPDEVFLKSHLDKLALRRENLDKYLKRRRNRSKSNKNDLQKT
jgi:uncharacterized RDD family membrane protein YckC